MNIYFWNVVFVLVGSLVISPLKKMYFSKPKINIGSTLFLLLIFLILFFEMAFRGDFNADSDSYYNIFVSSNDNLLDLLVSDGFLAGKDVLFQILNTLVRQVGGTFLHLQMIIAFAISIAYVKYVKENSPMFWLSFLIFFCSGTLYMGFNIARQLLVAALCLFCYKFIETREFGKYLIWVVLISGFHLSALVMIPAYFFSNIQWKKKSSAVVIGSAVVLALMAWIFADGIISIVTKFIYTTYSESTTYGMSYGIGILGTFKAIAMASGILFNYKKFDMTNPKERLVYNGTILYLIFAVVGGKIYMIQRFVHFFIPCLMIGYPMLLTKIQSRPNRQFATIVVICFFVASGLNVMLDGVYYFYWDNKFIEW